MLGWRKQNGLDDGKEVISTNLWHRIAFMYTVCIRFTIYEANLTNNGTAC